MISIVIPAYNEEKRIQDTLEKIHASMEEEQEQYEIIVVNDGSTDKTAELVMSLKNEKIRLLSYEKNRGKGGAVKHGIFQAVGEVVVFTDADLPYPPENIKKAYEKIKKGYDVVLGSRLQKKNGKAYPWYRTLMSDIFGLFVGIVLKIKERDTQCGFKAFTNQAARDIFEKVTLNGWGFDVEMIYIAEKQGKKICRQEVELFHMKEGSKIHIIKDTMRIIKEVFTIKENEKKGLY